tara:strand:+ start:156 stop:1040 length:885 start_codon:yes stop_codon:yes gene_type:complete
VNQQNAMAKKEKKQLKKRLLHKYRMVILNEDTFEERVSLKLTRLNVFILVTLSSLLLIAGTTVLIAFTPLKEYIPGYSSTSLKLKATELTYKTDSLETALAINNQYYESIKKVLSGDVKSTDIDKDSILEAARISIDSINLSPSEEDLKLREKVALEDKYNVFEETNPSNLNVTLFPPVNGSISEGYNFKEKHYAVDVVVAKDAPIKAAADGTVIFAEWTAETGYVVIIEHGNSLITVYKHNSALQKEQGSLVSTSEVIATAGSTGEYTTGPHLHFEIWSNGYPLNPSDLIDFE